MSLSLECRDCKRPFYECSRRRENGIFEDVPLGTQHISAATRYYTDFSFLEAPSCMHSSYSLAVGVLQRSAPAETKRTR